ncbi:MAG: hypothetical protein K8W52_18015 [Deltaproteobacteria bacterium]|nr:hypothetical protein [Deltaproteobacteria bacterium]
MFDHLSPSLPSRAPSWRSCGIALACAAALAACDALDLASETAAVGGLSTYDVGVDYHATGADFSASPFLTQYDTPSVRQTVLAQLQGMADHGATVISTRIWFVTSPGGADYGEHWRAHFPMSAQEQANLRAYAQDVASIVGSGGNRLRLDVTTLWLGDADYQLGNPATGLGWGNLSAADFTSRIQATVDSVVTAVTGVTRPDGVQVVDTIYFDGEVMIGAKPNQEWFLSTHYPGFVARVNQGGFTPSLYFNAAASQAEVLDNGFVDSTYPILNQHRSMYWIYRSLRFMHDHGLPLPPRIDFSLYPTSTGASYGQLIGRVLDDADATLPSLGAPQLYGAAETFYYLDNTAREALGHAFGAAAAANSRLRRVTFWTAPDGGGNGVNAAYPFEVEDFFPPGSGGGNLVTAIACESSGGGRYSCTGDISGGNPPYAATWQGVSNTSVDPGYVHNLGYAVGSCAINKRGTVSFTVSDAAGNVAAVQGGFQCTRFAN